MPPILLCPHLQEIANRLTLDALPSENFGFSMFLTDRYKLVVYEDTCEPGQLFDLLEDPTEDRNLCGDPNHAASSSAW